MLPNRPSGCGISVGYATNRAAFVLGGEEIVQTVVVEIHEPLVSFAAVDLISRPPAADAAGIVEPHAGWGAAAAGQGRKPVTIRAYYSPPSKTAILGLFLWVFASRLNAPTYIY